MQYKIPQNVRIEDKIVGPLTLKQLITAGIGGGITYAIYIVLARQYFVEIWLLPTAISGGLTLIFTFVKIRGLSFYKWILLMVEYFKNPKKRIFMMGAADFHDNLFKRPETNTKKAAEKEASSKAERDREQLKNIAEITKTLDNFGKQSTT
ncbi:MAG: hypothetical protein ACI9QC_000378 [Oceanicoccus sp.]|jgi:hypothetical protein